VLSLLTIVDLQQEGDSLKTTYEVHLARPWWAMPLLFGENVHVTYLGMGKAVCVCTYVRLTYAYIYSIYTVYIPYVLSGVLTVTDRYSFEKYADFICTT
jgi:hypothetical protein